MGAMEKFGKHAVLHHTIQPQTLDFLRSKSYDCGYGNIPSLIDNGIAVEKI
jgi:hypothetical protein